MSRLGGFGRERAGVVLLLRAFHDIHGLRIEREEDQDDRTEHEHVVGEIEDRAVEADGIDMEVDEIADVSEARRS